jgi:signal peptidase I
MEPTIHKGAPVVVDRFFYAHNEVERWQVILFALAHRQLEELPESVSVSFGGRNVNLRAPAFFFVKRVVGLSGERIRFTESKVLINGQELRIPTDLADRYGRFENPHSYRFGAKEFEVPDQTVFVIGDDVQKSRDSRHVGSIHHRCIHGRIVV